MGWGGGRNWVRSGFFRSSQLRLGYPGWSSQGWARARWQASCVCCLRHAGVLCSPVPRAAGRQIKACLARIWACPDSGLNDAPPASARLAYGWMHRQAQPCNHTSTAPQAQPYSHTSTTVQPYKHGPTSTHSPVDAIHQLCRARRPPCQGLSRRASTMCCWTLPAPRWACAPGEWQQQPCWRAPQFGSVKGLSFVLLGAPCSVLAPQASGSNKRTCSPHDLRL